MQPRERIELSDGTNTFYMHRVYIQASNSYYYIFEDPPPSLNTTYTVTGITTPNRTEYTALSEQGITCFTRGTRIETPLGPRPVEEIAIGDLVLTLDHGPQPVRWRGARYVSFREMQSAPGLRPFRVRAHAFGPNCPARPLIFSRQHRLLMTGKRLRRICGSEDETGLAHIHTLAKAGRIEQICPTTGVEYHHLLFARHEILMSCGLASESLLLTPYSAHLCDMLQDGQGAHHQQPDAPMRPARALLPNKEARRLMRKGKLTGVPVWSLDANADDNARSLLYGTG